MKYLIKTNDSASLDAVDYGRVVYDTANGKVSLQNIGGGVEQHEYVDLGLPSKLLWAKCNIGATNEEDAGLYFQWGDTQGYTAEQVGSGAGQKYFGLNDYKFSVDGSSTNFSKYNGTDGKTVLDPEDDAAHVIMGGNWRMPTSDDFTELCLNTDVYLVQKDGKELKGDAMDIGVIFVAWQTGTADSIKGVKFYKKNDKNSYLFIPVSGYVDGTYILLTDYGVLPMSDIPVNNINRARTCILNIASMTIINSYERWCGFPVRGVLAQ